MIASSPNGGSHNSESPRFRDSELPHPVAVANGISHVWILVVLALFVLVVTIISGLLRYPGLCAVPVLFFSLMVGLPRWLGSADENKHGQPTAEWQTFIDKTSAELGVAISPQATVDKNATGVHVVGAFRRKHIVIGQALHDRLNRQALKTGRLDIRPILVYYEMHHVASQDLEMLGGLEQLLDVFSWAAL